MNSSLSGQQEILHLTELACSGSAGPEDYSRLSDLITSNPILAQTYMSYVDLHATLASQARDSAEFSALDKTTTHPFHQLELELAGLSQLSPQGSTESLSQCSPRLLAVNYFRYVAASLTLMILAVLLVCSWSLFSVDNDIQQPVVVAEIVKFSSRFQHPEEIDPTQAWLSNPQLVDHKSYFLKHGIVTLRMLNNTEVTILGPAKFTPLSNKSIKLDSGELSAYITEPGQNFAVNTQYLNFLDQGTAFTVQVAGDHTEFKVFSGSVQVSSTSSSPKSINKQLSNNAFKYIHADASIDYFPISSELPDCWLSQLSKIDIHSTGTGKLIGQLDTKWIITNSNAQKKTISTVIEEPRTRYERNSESSSWLTLYDNKPVSLISLPSFPHGTEYIFTTSFNLDDPDVSTALIQGKFWVDDYVKEIRLNNVSVPFASKNNRKLYECPTEFIVNSNFKKGHNTLSFIVVNGGPNPCKDKSDRTSQMAFRAELCGYYHKNSLW
jgi:hypothetical protein